MNRESTFTKGPTKETNSSGARPYSMLRHVASFFEPRGEERRDRAMAEYELLRTSICADVKCDPAFRTFFYDLRDAEAAGKPKPRAPASMERDLRRLGKLKAIIMSKASLTNEEREWLRNSVYLDLKRTVQAALNTEREAEIREQKSRDAAFEASNRLVRSALEALRREQASRDAALKDFKRLRRSIRDNPAHLNFFRDVTNSFIYGLPEPQLTTSMVSELFQLENLWAISHGKNLLTAEERKYIRFIVFMWPTGIEPGYDSYAGYVDLPGYVNLDMSAEFQKVRPLMELAEENRRERERMLRPKPVTPVQTFQPQNTEFRKTYHPFDDVNRDRRDQYGRHGSGVNMSQHFSGGNNFS